jgi:hypothetical protein
MSSRVIYQRAAKSKANELINTIMKEDNDEFREDIFEDVDGLFKKTRNVYTDNYYLFIQAISDIVQNGHRSERFRRFGDGLEDVAYKYIIYFLNRGIDPNVGLKLFVWAIKRSSRFTTIADWDYEIKLFFSKGVSEETVRSLRIDVPEDMCDPSDFHINFNVCLDEDAIDQYEDEDEDEYEDEDY